MMEIYQGVDIVEIARFRESFQGKDALIADVFSDQEQEYCFSRPDPFLHLAARFAAKEASLKALGMGMSGTGTGGALHDIEVVHHPSGKPLLNFTGWVETMCRKKKIHQRTLSLSHSGNYAVATVILTGGNRV
jgi:holo-[acyl-carrier protein] synthase